MKRYTIQFDNETEKGKFVADYLDSVGRKKGEIICVSVFEWVENNPDLAGRYASHSVPTKRNSGTSANKLEIVAQEEYVPEPDGNKLEKAEVEFIPDVAKNGPENDCESELVDVDNNEDFDINTVFEANEFEESTNPDDSDISGFDFEVFAEEDNKPKNEDEDFEFDFDAD